MAYLPRRRFLALLAGGMSATYIEQHIGLWERVRSYFIPKPLPSYPMLFNLRVPPADGDVFELPMSWTKFEHLVAGDAVGLQLRQVQAAMPFLFARDAQLEKLLGDRPLLAIPLQYCDLVTPRLANDNEIRQFAYIPPDIDEEPYEDWDD